MKPTSPPRATLPTGVVQHTYTLPTDDGLSLHLECNRPPAAVSAILLLHGLTSSSAMFDGEDWQNLRDYLLHRNMEVWLLDWRGSAVYGEQFLDCGHNMDQVARYDIPAAVQHIRRESGAMPLHLLGHCMGGMALAMSLVMDSVDKSAIQSAVCANLSLYPKLGSVAYGKLQSLPGFARHMLGLRHFSVDPASLAVHSNDYLPHLAAQLGTNTCDNPVCRMLSFIWGDGSPDVVFKHANLHPRTHAHLQHYQGPASLSYYPHLQKMLQYAAAVSLDDEAGQPLIHYLDRAGNIGVPLLLCVGQENHLWYDSIQDFARILQTWHPGQDMQLQVYPGYAHNDVFMGVHAHTDIFPQIFAFLQQNCPSLQKAGEERKA